MNSIGAANLVAMKRIAAANLKDETKAYNAMAEEVYCGLALKLARCRKIRAHQVCEAVKAITDTKAMNALLTLGDEVSRGVKS